jgi:surface antigen
VWRGASASEAITDSPWLICKKVYPMTYGFSARILVLMIIACFATTAEAARKPRPAPIEAPPWSFWSTPAPVASERRTKASRAEQRNDSSLRSSRRASSQEPARASSGVGPRPRQWCGWYMRTQLGGGPEYNVAANWRRYGNPGSPQVGAVVVWPHHVGIITGRASNGQWIVKQGNYSGRVHEGPRSVSGAVFRV